MPTPEPSITIQFEKEIRFAGITFAYNPERENILRSLNLSIQPHEWLGIVGASGAGKTTIFDLLLRFYEPQAGSITIDSVPLREISTVSLRSKIAKVSQDTFLFPGTIRENLLLANPNATDEQLNATLNQVCLSKFLTQLPNGLDTNIGENGLLLSGGERQKLGLAQGLLRGCKVILLDEVTANVDRDSEGGNQKRAAAAKAGTGLNGHRHLPPHRFPQGRRPHRRFAKWLHPAGDEL